MNSEYVEKIVDAGEVTSVPNASPRVERAINGVSKQASGEFGTRADPAAVDST